MTERRPTTRGGVELTEELAERLASEAETGYDLDQGEIVQRGRLSAGAVR